MGLEKGWNERLGCNQWAWRRGGGGGWVVISGLGEGEEGGGWVVIVELGEGVKGKAEL